MSYIERYAKIATEPAFGSEVTQLGSYRAINYVIRCDMRINENLVEDDIVSAKVDQVSRGIRQREITGTLEHQFINPGIFRFTLGKVLVFTSGYAGSYAEAGPAAGGEALSTTKRYYVFNVIASCPSFSLEKGLRYPIEVARYYGTKINIHRITLDRGEDVTQELTLVAKNVNYMTGNYNELSTDVTIEPFTYYDGQLKKGTDIIAGVQRCVPEINRNLSARWSSDYSQTAPRTPKEFREARCEVTGTLTLDEATSKFIQACLNNESFTLTLTLFKNSWNRCIMTIKNVVIPEAPDTVTGREPYELEFPFRATGSNTGEDIITVEWFYESTAAGQLDGSNFKY